MNRRHLSVSYPPYYGRGVSQFDDIDTSSLIIDFVDYDTLYVTDPTLFIGEDTYIPYADSGTEFEGIMDFLMSKDTPRLVVPGEYLMRGEDSQENLDDLIDDPVIDKEKSKQQKEAQKRQTKRSANPKRTKKQRTKKGSVKCETSKKENARPIFKLTSMFFDNQFDTPCPIKMERGELLVQKEDIEQVLESQEDLLKDYRWKRPSRRVSSGDDNKHRCFKKNHFESSVLKVLAKGASNHGHATPPYYIIPDTDDINVVQSDNTTCTLCQQRMGDCDPANGLCRIPVNMCDSGKHIMCFSCFYIYCLCVEQVFNGYVHCACPGCNDDGKTRIRVHIGYSLLCKISMDIRGPPSSAHIQRAMEDLKRLCS